MSTRVALGVFAFGLFLAGGCGPAKLNEEKKYSLPAGGSEGFDLPAISKPQKITVEFTSTDSEVTVYLMKDFKQDDPIDLTPNKSQTLDSKKGKEGSFTVDVPENTATRILVHGGRVKTDVTLKVSNSK